VARKVGTMVERLIAVVSSGVVGVACVVCQCVFVVEEDDDERRRIK
jgi:hypothetical protein